MAKIRKNKGKGTPEISTASLPDIIFMLLFFFMVVTVLRESELKVEVVTPQASELTKLENKSVVNTIYLGKPTKNYQKVYGKSPRLQLGDKIADISDIPLFLQQHKETVRETMQPLITSSLRIDGDVSMGVVYDLKTQLRKSGQLKVNYSAKTARER